MVSVRCCCRGRLTRSAWRISLTQEVILPRRLPYFRITAAELRAAICPRLPRPFAERVRRRNWCFQLAGADTIRRDRRSLLPFLAKYRKCEYCVRNCPSTVLVNCRRPTPHISQARFQAEKKFEDAASAQYR